MRSATLPPLQQQQLAGVGFVVVVCDGPEAERRVCVAAAGVITEAFDFPEAWCVVWSQSDEELNISQFINR